MKYGAQIAAGLSLMLVSAGLVFASPTVAADEQATTVESADVRVNLNVPLGKAKQIGSINEYIAQAYEIGGIFIISIAVLTIMVAGLLWMTGGDNTPRIERAKAMIVAAVTGVLLYVLSYTILNLINPDLVNLKPLSGITTVERIDFELEDDIDIGRVPSAPNLVTIQGDNIIVAASDPRIAVELLPKVQNAAKQLQEEGYNFILSSAFRDPAKQQELIEANCQGVSCTNYMCTVTGKCSPPTCTLKNGPQSCPHTTGRAVDVWGGKNGAQCIKLEECIKNKEACAQNECQKAVIEAMRSEGFCRLCAEPWHFERPKMSACCN